MWGKQVWGRCARKNKSGLDGFGRMDARRSRRNRRRRKIPETITAGSRPQATSRRDNCSLLASVVHRRGLWKNSPPPDWVTTPDKGPAQLRHNRAAQAEVTTPYPAPRLAGPPATVAHCGGWKPLAGNRGRDGAQRELQPPGQRGKERGRLVKSATREKRGDGFKPSRIKTPGGGNFTPASKKEEKTPESSAQQVGAVRKSQI